MKVLVSIEYTDGEIRVDTLGTVKGALSHIENRLVKNRDYAEEIKIKIEN